MGLTGGGGCLSAVEFDLPTGPHGAEHCAVVTAC